MANVGPRTATSLAFVAVLAGAGRAGAADEPAEVRARAAALQSEGHKLLLEHDDAGALEKFQAAYQLVPSPKVLFNMGRAHERLGQDTEAFECFDRFLADARDVPPQSRAEAERSRSELRARIAVVEIVAPADAELTVDGRKVGRTPLSRPLALVAGTRRFRLERDGSVLSEKAVPVVAGAVTRFVIEIAPPAPPPTVERRAVAPLPPTLAQPPAPGPDLSIHRPPPEVASPPVYTRWWFWTVLGVAAAAAVAGAAAGGAFRRKDAGCPMEWQCP